MASRQSGKLRQWALGVLPYVPVAVCTGIAYSGALALHLPVKAAVFFAGITLISGIGAIGVMLVFFRYWLRAVERATRADAEEVQQRLYAFKQNIDAVFEEQDGEVGKRIEEAKILVSEMHTQMQAEIDTLKSKLRRNVDPDMEWARSELRNGRAYEEVQAEYLTRQNVDPEDATAVRQAQQRLNKGTKSARKV